MGQIWGSEKNMGQNMGQGTHLRCIFLTHCFVKCCFAMRCFVTRCFGLKKMYPFSNVVLDHIVFCQNRNT